MHHINNKNVSCVRKQVELLQQAAGCNYSGSSEHIRTKSNDTVFEYMSANMHVMIPRWLYSNCVLLQSFRAYVQLREGVVIVEGVVGRTQQVAFASLSPR